MSVYSVFNIGSGHTTAERNQTIVQLGQDCSFGVVNRHSIISDGVLTNWGITPGDFTLRMTTTINAIVNGTPGTTYYGGGGRTISRCITALQPGDTVNLTGHSRGAVMCHLIANRLATHMQQAGGAITINMVVLDPVNMTKKYATESGVLNSAVCAMLGEYRVIAMTNETSSVAFPLKLVEFQNPAAVAGRHEILTLPGTHGTATRCIDTAVGNLCLQIIKRDMIRWGTLFNTAGLQNDGEFCRLFAMALLEVMDPKHRGKVMVPKKNAEFSGQKSQKFSKDRAKLLKKANYGDYFPKSYFINPLHKACFLNSYGSTDYIAQCINGNVTGFVQQSIQRYAEWSS